MVFKAMKLFEKTNRKEKGPKTTLRKSLVKRFIGSTEDTGIC